MVIENPDINGVEMLWFHASGSYVSLVELN